MKRSKTLYLVAIFGWLLAAAGGCLPADAQSFAYVANAISNDVSAYKIDGITGVLSNVPSSPLMAGSGPVSVAVDPSGKFAYVANARDANVSAYKIDSTTGALSPVSGTLATRAAARHRPVDTVRTRALDSGRYRFVNQR
jgi:6-phosphogluconolactonase (cycloisomerase 2 family)